MLFGVAAGIADYFNIDPVIIRLIFVLLTISGGAGVLLYIVGIFIIPDESEKNNISGTDNIKKRVETVAEEIKNTSSDQRVAWRSEQIFGFILVILGFMFLSQMFWPWFNAWRLWPLFIIFIGLIMLIRTKKEKK